MRMPGSRLAGAALLAFGLTACSGADDGADGPAAEPEGGDPAAEAQLGPVDGRDLPGVDLDRIQVGDTAPDFSLASYDDGVVTLSDYRGEKDVILVFYRGHW